MAPRARPRRIRHFEILEERFGVGGFAEVHRARDTRLDREVALKELLPEAAELRVDRHRLPAIRSLNFVIHGLLQEGVAASTRQDPQAKGLGEWLRARVVDLPEALLS